MEHPDPTHVLLQHQGFLRALARRLVAPEEADDLVQETWLRVLERPPQAGGSLRQWLRTVAQNHARSERRRAGSRAARERARATSGAVPPVDEDRARAELLRSVLDAVLALDEPYQTTLLARYFRGQSAAEIAAQTRTPLATVRSRENRALAKLRERLDRRTGGDRLAWAGLLLRWVERPSWLATHGIRVLGFAAAAGVVGLLAVQWVLSLEAWRPARTVESGPGSSQREAVALAAAPESDADADAALPAPASRPSGGSSAASPPALAVERGEVRGRVLLAPGQPAVGQVVTFSSGPEADGLPTNGEETRTDSEGRFAFRHEVPGPMRSMVSVRADGFAEEPFTWTTTEAGLAVDLGDIVLRVGGRIVGTVVDEQGAPVRDAALEVWGGLADVEPARFSFPGPRARVGVDRFTGRFELNDQPPGRTQLTVHEIDAEGISSPTTFAFVRPNATTETRVVWSATGEESVEASHLGQVLRDLQQQQEARGHSAVVLDVRDANGQARTGYAVEAVRPARIRPNRIALHSGPEPLPGGRLDGLAAGDHRLDIRLPELGTRSVDVPGLAAGETRTVSVTFAPATALTGRIRHADGRPAEVEVLLLEPAAARDSAASPVLRRGGHTVPGSPSIHRQELASTWTDVDGAFHLGPLQPGRYAVHAHDGALGVASAAFEVQGDPAPQPVELILPAGGTLVATLHGLGAGDELELALVPVGQPPSTSPRRIERTDVATEGVPADGVVTIGPRPVGEYRVELGLPARLAPAGVTLDGRLLGRVPLGTVFLVSGRPTVVEYEVAHLALGSVSVRVLEDGAPGTGVDVRLLPAGDAPYQGPSSVTDAEGRVLLAAFPGHYSLRLGRFGLGATSWRIRGKSSGISVTSGQRTHVDVEFDPGGK